MAMEMGTLKYNHVIYKPAAGAKASKKQKKTTIVHPVQPLGDETQGDPSLAMEMDRIL
jgi:hypothetical protein